MLILTSKLFDTDAKNILHVPKPCVETIQALFRENKNLQECIVTDCMEELFDEDIKEIQGKKVIKTHLKGVYYIDRINIENLTGCAENWTTIIESSL